MLVRVISGSTARNDIGTAEKPVPTHFHASFGVLMVGVCPSNTVDGRVNAQQLSSGMGSLPIRLLTIHHLSVLIFSL